MKKFLVRTGKITAVFILFLVILYILQFEKVLLNPLMTGVDIPERYGDIIAVFGGGMRREDRVRIGYSTRERLDQAIDLYKKKERFVLVSDGSLYRKSPAIPLIMDYLQKNGVKKERILIEGDSQTTADNVRQTFAIAEELGLKQVIVCTSPYHQKRSQMLLARSAKGDYMVARSTESEVFEGGSFSRRLRNGKLILHEYGAILFLVVADLFH